jgi:hypothetical protein
MATSSLERYNRSLAAVRERFDANPALNAVRSNGDPQMLELFLLYFCAIGAQMTQPVEGWIRRSASRCSELGFHALAKALNQHAQAESGHHLMMMTMRISAIHKACPPTFVPSNPLSEHLKSSLLFIRPVRRCEIVTFDEDWSELSGVGLWIRNRGTEQQLQLPDRVFGQGYCPLTESDITAYPNPQLDGRATSPNRLTQASLCRSTPASPDRRRSNPRPYRT